MSAAARVTVTVARGGSARQAALDRWLRRAGGRAHAVIVEGAFGALSAPAEVRIERLAAGCVCCLGQLPLRVTLTRLMRASRGAGSPLSILLLLASGEHLDRVRALLGGIAGIEASFTEETMDDSLLRVRANGIEIACRVERAAPDRPWLVFAHSLAADHRMWAPQAAHFAGRFNLLRYDLRGHGGTSVPAGDYPLDLLAADAIALLDALGVARCHFVGLSLGGMVAQAAALQAPARFLSLTLADTASGQPPEAAPIWRERVATSRARGMQALVDATLERWFTPAFRAREPATVARIGDTIRATPVDGYVGCAFAVAHIDLTDRLAAIRCPVLVLVGREDRGTPPAMARAIAAAIPGARLVELADAAHLSNVEQPAAFNAALEAFLAQVSAD